MKRHALPARPAPAPAPQVQQALARGLQAHQAGRLPEAEQAYRQVLQTQPNQPDALHLLGVLAHQVGRHDVAAELISRAIGVNRRVAAYHGNLGVAMQALGQLEPAADSLKRAVQLDPGYLDGQYNLGVTLQALGRDADAVACYCRALSLAPGHLNARYNLGNALLALSRDEDAVACYRAVLDVVADHAGALVSLGVALQRLGQADEALACFTHAGTVSPDDPTVSTNLGMALHQAGRFGEAVPHLERALSLTPDRADLWYTLGTALHGIGRLGEAVTAFERALALDPAMTDAAYALGVVQQNGGQCDAAIVSYRRVLAACPDHAQAHNNLANTLMMLGQLDEALEHYAAERKLRPENAQSASNLLLARQYDPRVSRQTQADEARAWNAQFAAPLAQLAQPHQNDYDPDRRLRVGYVSSDFHRHPVGYFLAPILQAHDASRIDVYCYANNASEDDDLTARLRASASGGWRSIAGLDDDRAADLIREDGIDVLVDLSGHTAGHRLLTFARRPAPVQVSWLGYVDTTGLDAIDAVIADPIFCPPDEEWSFSERVVCLPNVRWCYAGVEGAPPVSELPALQRGTATFGCFNSLAKLTPETVVLWARVLEAVPDSRLVLRAIGFGSQSARDRYLGLFASHGIDPARIALYGKCSHAEYLAAYDEIDVGLDPFPFNGGTVTAESLWMGVPVVTLAGERPVGRMGAAQLGAVGLPELVAESPDAYVEIAAGLAADLPRLATIRRELRPRLQASPLGDVPAFTRDLEAAYRDLWRNWTRSQESGARLVLRSPEPAREGSQETTA